MLRAVSAPSSHGEDIWANDPRAEPERQYMLQLGHRIRELRERRQLTQKEAAQAAGIATDMISRLENGRYLSPGLRTLFRIASGLGTSISELLPESSHHIALGDHRLRDIHHRARPDQMELIVALAENVLDYTGDAIRPFDPRLAPPAKPSHS